MENVQYVESVQSMMREPEDADVEEVLNGTNTRIGV